MYFYVLEVVFLEDFLTIREMSEIWGISTRRLQILCKQDRVNGAIIVGNMWFIPKDTEKPIDARVKSGKYKKAIEKDV